MKEPVRTYRTIELRITAVQCCRRAFPLIGEPLVAMLRYCGMMIGTKVGGVGAPRCSARGVQHQVSSLRKDDRPPEFSSRRAMYWRDIAYGKSDLSRVDYHAS
jgi:hypothetical protein